VDCAEIRSGFVAGRVPDGPGVDEHLERCPHCHELFEGGAQLGRRLALSVLPTVEAGDLFARLDQQLAREVGLRARLRALRTRTRAALLAGVIGVTFLGPQLFMSRRADFGEYSPAVFWLVAALLVGVLCFGVLRLVRGASAPLRDAERDGAFAISLLTLPALLALIAPLGAAQAGLEDAALAWASSGHCFALGAAAVTPFLLLAWLFERRDRVPFAALASAGAVAGVGANLLLHIHCGSEHLGHLLLGHASIGLAWALALGLFGRHSSRAT
jgi:hypothetical protein